MEDGSESELYWGGGGFRWILSSMGMVGRFKSGVLESSGELLSNQS